MKRYILSVLFGMLPVLFSAAQSEVSLTAIGSQTTELKDGDTFTALTEEGVEMTFMVISEADKTCQVGSCPLSTTNWWSTPAIDEKTSGVVTIPSTINGYKVTRIGNWGFVYCFYLTSVNIPEGLESIGMLAFYSCQHLSSIKIPASVSYIGDNAFEITRLESVSVAEGNTFYDSRNNCNAIIETATNTLKTGCKNTIIPNDIVIIDNAAFYDCFGLTEVKLPETLTTIGRSAFAGCEDLKAINIPKNVTSISDYVFNDTPSLQSITVDSNNPAYDSRDNCNALIETASNTLMAGCQNTVIPTSVTSIGKSAFHQCSTLTSITIPRNVVRIGEGAFSWCKGLTTITSHITSPFTVTNIGFSEEVYQTATLYVPQGTKALYEATEGWKQFANIVEMGGEEETPAEAIDLGLPSGLKWASWNVGASSPEEYGNYYAWGEIEPKETYTWENYKYGYYSYENGSSNMVDIGSDIGGTDYDVAHVKWGGDWRLPTYEEIKELRDNCSYKWTSQNNVIGVKFTGPNGNSIFLPAAGRWRNGSLTDVGEWGDYLSSSIRENNPVYFEGFTFNSDGNDWSYANPVWGRYHGVSARPVCAGQSPEPYAVLSDEGQTVTFYYDTQKAERNGVEIQSKTSDNIYRAATQAVFDSSMSGYLPTSTACWFCNCSKLTSITGIEYINTEYVTDMSNMFYGCRSLTSLDLSSFNTEKVTTMSMMFQNCNALEELNLSSFNTSNVTSMFQMFLGCYNLKSLDVSSFDTKNVTNMRWMFGRCSRLTSLDVSGFNTENVYSFGEMFYGCSSLNSIDVSNFNTSKVTTMWGMFDGCQALASIDLSSFNTSNVTNMGSMFYSCSNLRTIYVGEGWTTTNVTESDDMFNNCLTLVGCKGTKYNAEHIDATYAHIDEGTSNPGYLTAFGEEPWSDSIELSDTETTMYESGTSTIDLSGGSGSYSLQSSDESVAKAEIIGGKLVITCIGEGTATITIIDKATGQTAIVSVTVVPPIKPTKRLYVYVGKKYILNINGGTGNYSIRSFNESIVTAEFVDSVATITGISEGSTKLEVTDNITLQKDTIEAICIKPTPVHIYTPTVTVYVGKTYPVEINGGTGSYTIQSSNESVVTAQFQDGNAMITGVGVGSATVTVTDEITGQKDSFYVHSIIAPVELSTREVPVVVGNTEKVSIISAGTFTVRSSDESIATATISDKNVVIKGVSEGKVTLTVTNTSTQKSETIVVTSYFDSVTPGDLIDLGLPSGTKWASRNVGAGGPTDFGSYFAWGETTPKESYNWANYKYYNWTDRSLTKYCTSSSYGTVDNKTTLDLEDDAAHANWGGDWRMPTHEESSELIDKCQWLRVIINGVLGKKCIGPNGNSIFFPASGVRFDDGHCYKGVDGQYWQSESGDNDLGAWRIYLFDVIPLERYAGLTVRPVCDGTPSHACDLSDIPTTSAYYEATAFLCDRTVIHGSDEDGRMAVNMPLKRAHLAKIAYRGVNLLNGRQVPATSVTNNFPTIYSDLTTPTEANSYYFQAAKALQYLEYGDGVSAFDRDRLEFNPSDSIERVNVLKALMEAFNIKPDVVGTENPFPNDDDAMAILKGNPLKFGYIRKAADLGIITRDNDKFRPFDYCLRGEAFIMLYRIMTKIEAGEIKDPNPQIADYFQPLNTTQKTIAMGSDMSMGNFRSYSKTDFAISGVMPLTFAHSYNSYSTTLPGVFYGQKMVNGVDETYQPMGPGWSHNYQGFVCVIGKGEDMRAVVNIGGRMLVFKANSSKLVPESFGVYDELKIENGDVVLKTKGQVKYTFSKQSGSKMPLLYLSSIRDRNGNELTLTYADGKNDTKVLSSVSDGNRELTFYYKSGTDLLEEVSDPLGRSISFGYEYNDNTGEYMLSSFTDAEGNTTSYSYGDEGQRSTARLLTRIQLPKGNYIENEYDANRRLTQTVTGLNGVPQAKTTMSVTTDYTSTANTKSTVKVERGNNPSTYSYAYNENNAVTSLTGSDDLSISCTYDDNTQPQLPTAVETNSTNISKVEYDDRGNILSVTEKSNSGFGERTVSMSYNSMNDVKSFTDALGNTTYFSYDNSGNLISVSKPEGVTTERTVDSRGLVKSVTNPMGIKTNFDYNEYGNVIETTLPVLDIVSSIKYDAASRPLSITDPLGRTSHTTYNRNDQVTEEVDAMGHTTQYDYDPNGNLTAITNAKGGVTTMTYDDATDQLTSLAFAGSTKHYSYNKDGSLNTFTKPDGTRLNYSYDALGRITSDGVNSYSYDSKLRLKSISGNGQTLTYNYDGFNRVSSVGYSGSSSNTVSYGYDDNDNLTSMTYPDGNKVIYQYDKLDRLTSVKAWNGKQVSYSYRKDGQLSGISYPNGMMTTFSYDEAGRMVEKKSTLSNGTVIASYGYVLDKNGKITGQATKEPYDISGPVGKDTEFSYNSGNRITRAGSVSFTFDGNGNTTKRGSDSYTWDVQDRLVSAEGKSYVYDPMGNIRKYGSTEYTIDPLGMGNVLSDTETGASYIYGNGLEMRIVNGVTQYFVTDSRGSVVAIVDDRGNITHKYQYDEFGKVIQSKEADFNPFRYVGKWGVMYNTDIHYYMRARHYDPTIGRFLSEDPIWSTNLYPYADNNPIMGIDPEGLFTDDSPEFKKYKAILDKKYNDKEIDYNTYYNLVNTLYYVPSISMTKDERDNFRNNIQAQFSSGKLTLDNAANIRTYADNYFYGNTEFWFGKKEEFYIIPEKVPVQQIEFVPLPENTLRSSAQNQNGNQIFEIEDREEYMEGYNKKLNWLYKIGVFFFGKK